MIDVVGYRKDCSSYVDCINDILEGCCRGVWYNGECVDDWREYDSKNSDEKIVVVMTPPGDLWIFEVTEYKGLYDVLLIGHKWEVECV